ncbi:50S ribosomal protein L6 [Candidatus Giovannonibacteria bacterium RIFCSPHIGHO2_02_42_15]|uniref:Large ribosomal subunit protein uL6 n=2 Tax=Candidatus Giovannoniibacteriota TaxID=1752738 RepID=A0A1F5VP65_9BACT|nr:MAG: 50S ribosomal protein L6 [Candidatus Giovannonibacteria bacterium GW2011_GWF2_42_19]OGF65170.1 MAG: 50S ribosomal protein L6 [Candidatus Giovannonibacteria bacterium RIFCSPHIGHO2_02_42_15]
MSRLAKKPIQIPAGVEAKFEGGLLKIRGPKGELNLKVRDEVGFEVNESGLFAKLNKSSRISGALLGTYASHAKNMIEGVVAGFSKRLDVQGIGYKANLDGANLLLNLGFSHPVKFQAPEGIVFKIEKNIIVVSGIDKEKVGRVAAEIRALKKPEPYKGKGIRYEGEQVRRKAGKKAAGAGA